MFRQTISLTTLVVFVIYSFGVSGCSTVFTRHAEEITLVPPTHVTGHVAKNGERVTYDSTGATVDPFGQQLNGIDSDGSIIRVSLSEVDSVFYVDPLSKAVIAEPAAPFGKREVYNHQNRLKGEVRVIFTEDETLRIEKEAGFIDVQNRTLGGFTASGDYHVVPVTEVDSLLIQQPDGVKTIANVVLISAAALAVVYVLALKNAKWESRTNTYDIDYSR